MKKIFPLLCLLFAFLAGCAAPKHLPAPLPGEADARWQAFLQRSDRFSGDLLSGSLRFGPVNDTRRVTFLLWSGPSGGAEAPVGLKELEGRSIRLEVMAGTGSTIAKGLFTDGRMQMVLPLEKIAFVGKDSPEGLRRLLGLSLPLSMEALSDFLAGRMASALDVSEPEGYENLDDGGIRYRCSMADGTACELTLDADALPVRWSAPGGWTMDVRYDERGLPEKLSGSLRSTEGELRLVLLVKERSPLSGLSASGLSLDIPPGFEVRRFDH